MENKARIHSDYIKLKNLAEKLDWMYIQHNGHFKVGHYDDERKEIQFYSVEDDRVNELKQIFNNVDINDENGLLRKYELFISPVIDNINLVLIRPRLLN